MKINRLQISLSFLAFWLGPLLTVLLGFLGFGFYYLCLKPIPFIPLPEEMHFNSAQNLNCTTSEKFPGLSQDISIIKKGKSDYFPRENFGNEMSSKHSVAGWYSKHLLAMEEESLLDINDEDAEVYRFLWLRTFDRPILIKIAKTNYKITFSMKELDGTGGNEPGKISNTNEFSLSDDDFCRILDLIDKANFWQMPIENDVMGNDGAQWVLEGVKDNRYHIVDRWSPREGDFREVCIFLLKLSGRNIDELKDDLY